MEDYLVHLGQLLSSRVVVHQILPSAQQQVVVVEVLPLNDNVDSGGSAGDSAVVPGMALETKAWMQGRGSNKLVVRRWLNTCRWWNLHRATSTTASDIARWEMAGYRIARLALHEKVPCVWYSSMDDEEGREGGKDSSDSCTMIPWAVIEYRPNDDEDNDNNNSPSASSSGSNRWMYGMVQVRHEFGFDEPHPRWGRVPEHECLTYALMVLHQVIVPLHSYCRQNAKSTKLTEQLQHLISGANPSKGYTFHGMIAIYKDACQDMTVRDDQHDGQLTAALQRLGQGIQELDRLSIDPLPPVLCHLDYQPQNLQFVNGGDSVIGSVFDWEEAAYADPRFDLLLLGRKVCANHCQAQTVWESYEQATHRSLGPLAPWLQLETIHSLTTLLLQRMDLLGGGRSPWESKPDLWGKIEREIARLDRYSLVSSSATSLS